MNKFLFFDGDMKFAVLSLSRKTDFLQQLQNVQATLDPSALAELDKSLAENDNSLAAVRHKLEVIAGEAQNLQSRAMLPHISDSESSALKFEVETKVSEAKVLELEANQLQRARSMIEHKVMSANNATIKGDTLLEGLRCDLEKLVRSYATTLLSSSSYSLDFQGKFFDVTGFVCSSFVTTSEQAVSTTEGILRAFGSNNMKMAGSQVISGTVTVDGFAATVGTLLRGTYINAAQSGDVNAATTYALEAINHIVSNWRTSNVSLLAPAAHLVLDATNGCTLSTFGDFGSSTDEYIPELGGKISYSPSTDVLDKATSISFSVDLLDLSRALLHEPHYMQDIGVFGNRSSLASYRSGILAIMSGDFDFTPQYSRMREQDQMIKSLFSLYNPTSNAGADILAFESLLSAMLSDIEMVNGSFDIPKAMWLSEINVSDIDHDALAIPELNEHVFSSAQFAARDIIKFSLLVKRVDTLIIPQRKLIGDLALGANLAYYNETIFA